MRQRQLLPGIAVVLVVLVSLAIGNWPIAHAEGDDAKPVVLRSLGTGPFTLTLAGGTTIPNVSGIVVANHCGVRLLVVHVRSGDKVEEIFVNPDHVLTLKAAGK
jgi:hypothetical protein